MKYPIRYFSIGLFVASLIVLIGYYLSGPSTTSSNDETIDEMIGIVEKEGYRVISESEYISLATSKNELNTLKKELEKESDADGKAAKDADKKKQDEKKDDKKDTDKNKSDSDKTSDDKKKDNNKKKNHVVKYTLVVEPNMVPSEISKILEKNKIIKSANDFNQYMEKNDYSPYLQIGEFKLKSDMSKKEIAKVITNR